MAKGKNKKGDPSWFRTWKMIVGVVAGLGIIFSATFATWTYAKGKLTEDVSARLDTLEGRVNSLTISVDALTVAINEKKYETDKELVLMVIEAYQAKQGIASTH